MPKKLNPKAIEAARKKSSRAERRSQKKQIMQEDIVRNQGNGGVKIIPPPPLPVGENGERPKLRVAAYCRVSTQEEEQLGSFEMQVHHFQQRIEGNPAWELVKIYKDEGRSGTTIHGRQGFQDMIADAVAGKIDLILTKSINRFGRNIVDMKFDFSALNFEVIDANVNATPDMFVNTNGLTFTRRVLEDMGYPQHVVCQIDVKNRVFAIRGCKSNELKAFKFSKPKEEQKATVTITNKNVLEPIRKCMAGKRQADKRYKVTGFFVTEAKTMCFALEKGVQEDYRTNGKDE